MPSQGYSLRLGRDADDWKQGLFWHIVFGVPTGEPVLPIGMRTDRIGVLSLTLRDSTSGLVPLVGAVLSLNAKLKIS